MNVDEFVGRAFSHFRDFVHAVEVEDGAYVHRSVKLYATAPDERRLLPHRDFSDPFIFLTGQRGNSTYNYFRNQGTMTPPAIALLLGPYGTGKTELVYRLCEFLRRQSASEDCPKPVPVSLSQCRAHSGMLDHAPDISAFLELLEAGFPSSMLRTAPERYELLRRVRSGEIILILDALDELVDRKRRHLNFMKNLRLLLTDDVNPGTSKHAFRVIVTMRREYLSAVDGPVAQDTLANLLFAGDSHNVYLIEINQFSDEQMYDYLGRRLSDTPELLHKVNFSIQENPTLSALLHRPLLLKIFVDWLKAPELERDEESKRNVDSLLRASFGNEQSGPGGLFSRYVEYAHDLGLYLQGKLKTRFSWDKKKLAATSVAVFRTGAAEFTNTQISTFLDPTPSTETDDVFDGIHKCPFLIRYGEGVRFSHRAFFEFFTAQGIADEVKEKGIEEADAFNQLVVNSDMRKFLQYFMGERQFYEDIQLSCGLSAPAEWGFSEAAFLARKPELRETLHILTEGMTKPELRDGNVEDNIGIFLRNCDPKLYHPGYMVYCFHAVATYLFERPLWVEEYPHWDLLFKGLLMRSFERALDGRADRRQRVREWWERVVERILYVGQKLLFAFVKDKARHKHEWLDDSWNNYTAVRIKRIIDDIAHTRFE